ncbi:uncharacterized protein LOC123554287 isoform X2 [Mercenaria mercenaria]|uniref:uncharacterized protein LOC123554287 isoform X2 n=1 Tax=Mercenaria mercenaria TaxID=6596 RepID=UPI00234EC490|nr:uncharacterized protein LOC123554287 isoform X2 [Mercenaria mercenaria]XP_053404245.1 uncharacterized protein LOC123554287 isoform X2 [Mercenaria mercenaria]
MSDVASKTADAARYKYDVFIVYKTDEDEDLALQIDKELERNSLKVIAQWKPEAFPAGHPIFESIDKCVNNSAKTLVILTKQALESKWIILELIHTIEQSKRRNVLTLRLLLHGVNDKDVKFLKRGLLASVPHFSLDLKKDDWAERLIENIQNEVPLPDILPLEGSLAHGLVFSHYSGFLSYVLPVLRETIEKTRIYRDMPHNVSRKYYILLPESCRIYDTLEGYDEENQIRIEKGDNTEFKRMHAGKTRTFKISIYNISKQTASGIESYYFFADFPNVLKAMYTMNEKSLVKLDMRLQLARFCHVLGDVVNHAENESCFDTVKIVRYDEKVTTMQNALFHAVKGSVATEVRANCPGQDINNSLKEEDEQPLADKETNAQYDTSVSCLPNLEKDGKVAAEITSYLRSKNITVYLDKGNEREFHKHPAKWHIFVLSKQVVMEPNSLLVRCSSILNDGLSSNSLDVLPVIVDIAPVDVPRYIKWVTLVSASEPKYCEKLLMSMKGGVVRMRHRLPSGDVATGLAWAYVINYLRITLLCRSKPEIGNIDLKARIEKFLDEKKIQCGCILKMFPVLPKSCTLEDDLQLKANEGLKEGSEVIKYLGKLEPVYQNTGGQLGRPFYLHVYMYTDRKTQRSVCFIGEYFTPGNCLHAMAYSYPFAGLQNEDMVTQGERVVYLVSEILGLKPVKQELGDMSHLVKIIYYDDKQESLLSALQRHILEERHAEVYAPNIVKMT